MCHGGLEGRGSLMTEACQVDLAPDQVRKVCRSCGYSEIISIEKLRSENFLLQNVCGPSGWRPRCSRCNRWSRVQEVTEAAETNGEKQRE